MNKMLKKLIEKMSLRLNEKATSAAGRNITDSRDMAEISENREIEACLSHDIKILKN